MTKTTEHSDSAPDVLAEYRKSLVEAEQKAQEDFDKTVLSLSGGGLGISFVFLKDVIGVEHIVLPGWLFAAWIAWATSTLLVLASFFVSNQALRRARRQVDAGTIYSGRAGGRWALTTDALNGAGAILFFIGVICITMFSGVNLKAKGEVNARKETAQSSPSSTASTDEGRSSGEGKNPGGLRPTTAATAPPSSR